MKPNEYERIQGAIDDAALRVINAVQLMLPTPPLQAPLCRDCEHCRPTMRTQYAAVFFTRKVADYSAAQCARPGILSPVDGKPKEFCSVERGTYGRGPHALDTCREEGRYFSKRNINPYLL